MNKADKSSSSGTKNDSSTNVEVEQVRQPTANEMLAEVPGGLNTLSKLIFNRNRIKWDYPEKRNTAEILCLMHSEISEALEADRKERYCPVNIKGVLGWENEESFLAHYKETVKGTFEEEMADIFIRLLDLCGNKSIDIENHVKAKLKYTFTSNNTYGKKY